MQILVSEHILRLMMSDGSTTPASPRDVLMLRPAQAAPAQSASESPGLTWSDIKQVGSPASAAWPFKRLKPPV